MNIIVIRNRKYTNGGKQPYFRITAPPEKEGGKWREIGALWLKVRPNGEKYYTGSFKENVRIQITDTEGEGTQGFD
jgi:uncharacterized protein (DUF736 family)